MIGCLTETTTCVVAKPLVVIQLVQNTSKLASIRNHESIIKSQMITKMRLDHKIEKDLHDACSSINLMCF